MTDKVRCVTCGKEDLKKFCSKCYKEWRCSGESASIWATKKLIRLEVKK